MLKLTVAKVAYTRITSPALRVGPIVNAVEEFPMIGTSYARYCSGLSAAPPTAMAIR